MGHWEFLRSGFAVLTNIIFKVKTFFIIHKLNALLYITMHSF